MAKGCGDPMIAIFSQDHLEWVRVILQRKMCDYYQKGNVWAEVACMCRSDEAAAIYPDCSGVHSEWLVCMLYIINYFE